MRPAFLGSLGRAVVVCGVLLGGPGCIEVPREVELTLEDDDDAVYRAVDRSAGSLAEGRMGPPPHRVGPDYDTWPLSSDPQRARFGGREVRTHPLWPTPIDEPCPTVMFASIGPELDGGDMFDRVTERLASVDDPRLSVRPTEIMLLHDHLERTGLRLVAASHTAGSCMMGWSHTHCVVTHDDVFCPDGSSRDLERLVRAERLVPRSLDQAGWLELAVVMSGVESIVIEPRLVGECASGDEPTALAPSVEIDGERATVRFTAITDRTGRDYTVIVERSGLVTMETSTRWEAPRYEEWE